LGTCLEWIVGRGLSNAKSLGILSQFERERDDLPEETSKERRVNHYPDWWVKLYNGIEAEIECKAWTVRPKKYVRNPLDSTFWMYDHDTVYESLAKNWLPNSKRILVITCVDLFTDGGKRAIKEREISEVLETLFVARDPDDHEKIRAVTRDLIETLGRLKGAKT